MVAAERPRGESGSARSRRAALLLGRVREELERCAVGRDNPTHRRLVAGTLSADELRTWAYQQWHWHRAFPGVLATLASNCPLPERRAALLLRAAAEDGALPAVSGRCAEWARVSAELGVSPDELAAASPSPETEAMIAIQTAVASRSFVEGWIGIAVGVDGETQLHSAERRVALREHYGVAEEALCYVRSPDGDPVARAVTELGSCLEDVSARTIDGACEALRLVLHARWSYFSALARL